MLSPSARSLILSCCALLPSAQAIKLPNVSVSVTTKQLVDNSRLDPYAPAPTPRSVVVSIFTPVENRSCNWVTTPYMPFLSASVVDAEFEAGFGIPKGFVTSQTWTHCANSVTGHRGRLDELPLVLFSPGLGGPRFLYNILAAKVAQTGRYRVVTVDHPYDAAVVQLDDGTLIYGQNLSTLLEQSTETATTVSFVNTRVADLAFVERSFRSRRSGKTATIGHSLGGASSISALNNDTRFRGALNLDGSLWSDVIQKGTPPGKPVMFFAHNYAVNGSLAPIDATWNATWPNLRGSKRILQLEGSAHSTFSDLPLLAAVLLQGQPAPAAWTALLGSIDPEAASDTIAKYIVAFLQFTFGGKEPHLLEGPNKQFPEVLFVR